MDFDSFLFFSADYYKVFSRLSSRRVGSISKCVKIKMKKRAVQNVSFTINFKRPYGHY